VSRVGLKCVRGEGENLSPFFWRNAMAHVTKKHQYVYTTFEYVGPDRDGHNELFGHAIVFGPQPHTDVEVLIEEPDDGQTWIIDAKNWREKCNGGT
jgi:hypothetical protein